MKPVRLRALNMLRKQLRLCPLRRIDLDEVCPLDLPKRSRPLSGLHGRSPQPSSHSPCHSAKASTTFAKSLGLNSFRHLWLLAAFWFASTGSPAEKKTQGSTDPLIRPVVSPAGIQRIYDNIEILKKNIRDADGNANLCEKNREIVLLELQDLEKLEQEQTQLIKDYERYIENARLQTQRNDSGIQKILKWEAENENKIGATGASNSKNQLDVVTKVNTARQDKLTRERWRLDTDAKVARVNRLIAFAKDNLKELQAHRVSMRSQATGWSQKRREFEGLIKELIAKKSDIERLAEVKKKELPSTSEGEEELE